MRKRWRWPILDVILDAEIENMVGVWIGWLILGFVFLIIPALIVDTNQYGHLYMGSYLLIALIVYATPLAAGVLAAFGIFLWFLLDAYGAKLLPRRVSEPVTEDLRTRF